MKNTGVTELRTALFDTLKKVGNINNPDVAKSEKITLEEAEMVCNVSSKIIDTYKVEVQAMGILAKADNANLASSLAKQSGILQLEQ